MSIKNELCQNLNTNHRNLNHTVPQNGDNNNKIKKNHKNNPMIIYNKFFHHGYINIFLISNENNLIAYNPVKNTLKNEKIKNNSTVFRLYSLFLSHLNLLYMQLIPLHHHMIFTPIDTITSTISLFINTKHNSYDGYNYILKYMSK